MERKKDLHGIALVPDIHELRGLPVSKLQQGPFSGNKPKTDHIAVEYELSPHYCVAKGLKLLSEKVAKFQIILEILLGMSAYSRPRGKKFQWIAFVLSNRRKHSLGE